MIFPLISIPRFAALMLTGLLLGGCQALPQAPQVDLVDVRSPLANWAPKTVEHPTNGSLFSTAKYQPAFEGQRARYIGDSLTITIVENVSAAQTSSSSLGRTGSTSSSITAFPLLRSADLAKASVGASTANSFEGKGDTASTNTFSGSITTTVVDILPNGHLVVTGEKQIGLNQNVDVLRFSGTVDPRFILPGSTVSSTQVANARIQSRGRGAQDEAQTVGWLSRFFLTLSPF